MVLVPKTCARLRTIAGYRGAANRQESCQPRTRCPMPDKRTRLSKGADFLFTSPLLISRNMIARWDSFMRQPHWATFAHGGGRTRQGWIFYARSLRKRASGLKFGAAFPIWAVWHLPSSQVEGSLIRPRNFRARYFKPEVVFRSERGQKIQPHVVPTRSPRGSSLNDRTSGGLRWAGPHQVKDRQRPDCRAMESKG